jgi:cation transport regulator ChaC
LNAVGPQFVFGYGSLTARPGPLPTRGLKEDGFVADVAGLRRVWGVAMDNRRDLPGYKYYTDAGGRRPEVFVAYLDLVPEDTAPAQTAHPGEPAARVNGVCLPVDDAVLEALDRRERNYERTDVSDRIEAGGAQVWAYIGMAEARERLAEGRRTDTAVIDAGYVATVEAGFAALGDNELARVRASLQPGDLPMVQLTRHELR